MNTTISTDSVKDANTYTLTEGVLNPILGFIFHIPIYSGSSNVSSPEISPEIQPPAAKKPRTVVGAVAGVLHRESVAVQGVNCNAAAAVGGSGTTTPSSNGLFNSMEHHLAAAGVVPLLKKTKKPDQLQPQESEISAAYPQSSPSPSTASTTSSVTAGPAFLHPSSPKHITNSETGSLGIPILLVFST